jgi:hypothetical protein
MDNFIQILKSTFESTSSAIVAAAPKVAACAVVIVVGLLVARIARAVVQRGLKLVRFESLANRVGMTNVLKRAEANASASEIMGTLVYWTLLLFTAMVSLQVLGFATPETFAAVGAMIPSVVIACAILILGLNVSSFIAKLIQTAVVNAEIRLASFAIQHWNGRLGRDSRCSAIGYLGRDTDHVVLHLLRRDVSRDGARPW